MESLLFFFVNLYPNHSTKKSGKRDVETSICLRDGTLSVCSRICSVEMHRTALTFECADFFFSQRRPAWRRPID
ncbi:hypothetical protein CW304_31475 [Bacillus sp. UFRGS-B20]|nr:hypothetical protein CW304_31475 [Bacillus sp. UFRGS-B20]